ncbi:chaperonin 10-like protein [Lophiotrema nucula]|uniref:Chaperonin 10-like protein n=1 Tax=Lophiotrema nucula TaxID=690887 RepID=A0A6A5YQK9_9PLEO|nr:chaperonin 10-like protein [Lophiotrema nucula]
MPGSPEKPGPQAAPDIPDKMLAAQVVEFHKPYKVQEVPVPKDLAPNDLLIKVAVASLCHTDFMVRDDIMGTKLPCTGSHEGSGTVVATGSDVEGFEVGDRVMSGIIYHPCRACADCLGPETYTQYCAHSGGYLGVTTNGFFAEYARVDSTQAAKMPDRVSFETAAPLACAGCTVWRAVILPELVKGQWLAIVGSGGGLGHLGVQFAKALGLNVIGIDARDEGLELTKKNGADVVVDARLGKEKVVEEVKKVTNGEGAAATVNVSDNSKAAAISCAVTAMHGTMVQVAQPPEVSVPFQEFIFRDVRIRGSLICSPEEGRRMLDIVAEHGISVHTNPFDGLKEIEKLVELAEGGKMKGKGIIIMDPEQIKKEKESGLDMV